MKKTKIAPSTEWPASFTEADRRIFKKLRIPAKLVIEAGVRRVKDGEARRAGLTGKGDLAGLLFPYFDIVTGKQISCRVRRDNPECGSDGRPEGKYMMPPAGHGRRILYYPPGTKEKIEGLPDVTFVLVEAEKSALALTAFAERVGFGNSLLPIAMGGCWGWSQSKEPLPDLDLFEEHTVFVLLDANLSTNPQVRQAHDALISALYARRCSVHTFSIPQLEGVNGPDDLLAQPKGDVRMMDLLSHGRAAVVAPYSDDALATQFAEEQKENLRYVHTWAQWLVWDGQRWKEDDKQEVGRRTQDLCHAAAGQCGNLTEARRIRSSRTIEAVQHEAGKKAAMAGTTEQWDANPFLLATPDGVVDLRTGRLLPARREDYITKMTAVAPRAERPERFLQFLKEITNSDNELERYLQRVAGYCLTGNTSEHALFFLYGTGANGKSVFVNTLLGILGDYARVASMESFTASHNPQHPTDLAGLCGRRLVAATETENGSRWAESKIKAVTGGEPISARKMRQDFFQFTPQCKLLLSGNHQPALRNVDEAMRRRIHLVPFTVTIPESKRDRKLAGDLRSEWPGILQWMIAGCLAWQLSGLQPPRAVITATQDYFVGQDLLAMWIAEAVEPDKNARTSPSELYQNYHRWADRQEEYVWSQREFSQRLKERGYASVKGHGGARCVPLRLRTATVGAGRKFANEEVRN